MLKVYGAIWAQSSWKRCCDCNCIAAGCCNSEPSQIPIAATYTEPKAMGRNKPQNRGTGGRFTSPVPSVPAPVLPPPEKPTTRSRSSSKAKLPAQEHVRPSTKKPSSQAELSETDAFEVARAAVTLVTVSKKQGTLTTIPEDNETGLLSSKSAWSLVNSN